MGKKIKRSERTRGFKRLLLVIVPIWTIIGSAALKFKEIGGIPMEKRVVESTLETIAISTGIRTTVYRAKERFEAPMQFTPDDDYNDWFAHPSPDGKWIAFLSYDKSVKGHPPDRDVVLRLMSTSGGGPKILATLFGGQGTINVPSWSPDSKYVAFVSYRLVKP